MCRQKLFRDVCRGLGLLATTIIVPDSTATSDPKGCPKERDAAVSKTLYGLSSNVSLD